MNQTKNLHQNQNVVNEQLRPTRSAELPIVSIGYDSITTHIDLVTGYGTTLPDPSISGSYDLLWWNASDYISPTDDPYVEIVKCIAKSNDTLIVMRSQQQTLASHKNIPGKSYNMALLPDSNLEELSYYNLPQPHGSSRHTGTIGDHTNLTSIGTKTHTAIDTAIDTTLPGLVTTHAGLTATHGVSSAIVGVDDSQTLTNKYIYDANSFVIAQGIRSATTMVYTASSAAPSAGQVLTATSSGNATWQSSSGIPTAPPLPQNVPKIASTTIRNSHDAQAGTSSTSLVLLKTMTMTNGLKGTIRMYVDTNGQSAPGWSDISFTVNSIEIARIEFLGGAWTTRSADVTRTFLPGESIQLWGLCHNGTMYVANWRLAYDNDPNILVSVVNS